MTSLQYRRRRFSKPNLESLDDRIVPSAAGSAIHAQAIEARAEHVAEVRAERLQQMEIRAEHQAEIRAERAAVREQRAEHRAELRAARIQARQARLAAHAGTHAAYFNRGVTLAAARSAASSPQSSAVVGNSVASGASTTTSASSTSTDSSASTTTTDSTARPVAVGGNISTTSTTSAASTDVSDIKNGPMAKAGQDLITVYTQFEKSSGSGDFALTGDLANRIRIQGDSVGVDVGTNPGQMASVESTLKALGMQITATDATTGKIEGYLPISQLPTVSQNSNVLTLAPNYLPVMPPPVDPNGGFQAV